MTVMSLAFMPIWGIGTFRADLTRLERDLYQAGRGNLTADGAECYLRLNFAPDRETGRAGF